MATRTVSAANTEIRAGSYIEWGAILAGSALACAISVVLLQFGGTVGLSVGDELYRSDDNLAWRVFGVGLWMLWVQLISSMCGGYLAGRMRQPVAGATDHESEVRDGVHGLLVWATSTLITVAVVALSAFLSSLVAALTPEIEPSPDISESLARKGAIIFGFAMAASSLASAVAAWWMGTMGGDHRDGSFDLSRYISFRTRNLKKK